jgi:DNA replication protein DnaC
MHLDGDKCAQCGHKLDDGFENDACNTALDQYASLDRPHFCSEECVDKAIAARVNADLDYLENDLEQAKQDASDEPIESPTRDDAYHRAYAKLKQFKDERPQRFQSQLESATRTYFNRYFEQSARAQHSRNAEEQEKAHEKFLAQEASSIARAEQRVARESEKRAMQAIKDEEKRLIQATKDEEKRAIQAAKEAEIQRKADIEAERLRPIPFEMPSDHSRYEGVHVLGPNGSGKTTLAQEFIIHDIMRDDCPSLVIIDPKGTLVNRLKAFKHIDPNRLVIIDATSPHPAKLGFFAKPANMDSDQRLNQAIATYKYILKAANFAFTPKQGILFRNLVLLMFATRGTISSLLDFLREYPGNPKSFADQISLLPEGAQKFFNRDFQNSYRSTADEVNVRLHEIHDQPMLKAMFDTTECHVDFYDCIRTGKIVLVNAGMALDEEASRIVGRYVIAMVLNAVYIRATMPEPEWRPTFLVIDEFQQFVDDQKTPELLRYPREFNFGSMIMHHNMFATEISQGVRVAISGLTGIKFCANPKGMDASYMVADFECDRQFLSRQLVSKTHVHFASIQRGKYQTAVSVKVPLGNLDAYPKRDKAAVAAVDAANAARVHSGPRINYVSEDEWIDHLQSGHIDEEGRSTAPNDDNWIMKIDPNMQRWHITLPSTTPTTSSATPSPAPPRTSSPPPRSSSGPSSPHDDE